MRLRSAVLVSSLFVAGVPAAAQDLPSTNDQAGMQMPMPMPMPASHRMSMAENPLGIDSARDGSGTSWLPDASPAHGLMRHHGPWMLMLHGNGFLEYIKTG